MGVCDWTRRGAQRGRLTAWPPLRTSSQRAAPGGHPQPPGCVARVAYRRRSGNRVPSQKRRSLRPTRRAVELLRGSKAAGAAAQVRLCRGAIRRNGDRQRSTTTRHRRLPLDGHVPQPARATGESASCAKAAVFGAAGVATPVCRRAGPTAGRARCRSSCRAACAGWQSVCRCWSCSAGAPKQPLHARTDSCPFCGETQ